MQTETLWFSGFRRRCGPAGLYAGRPSRGGTSARKVSRGDRRRKTDQRNTGIRIPAPGRGGNCRNIRISDIIMNDIREAAVIFETSYADRPVGSAEAVKQRRSETVLTGCRPERNRGFPVSGIPSIRLPCRLCGRAYPRSGRPGRFPHLFSR